MKKVIKRMGSSLIASTLIVGLIFCNGSFMEAKKIVKEESVFVNAKADGSVSEVTVSDWLKNSGVIKGSLHDESDLKEISNTKGEEKFSQSDNKLNWNMSGNDIFYQGKTEKSLPIEMKITYYLDGKEISPEQILGKSGDVKIRVKYINHSSVNRVVNGEETKLYTPFISVTGMILPGENFSDVEVKNGRVINDGSKNIVIGYGLPGLKESLKIDDSDISKKLTDDFTITAKAEKFELGNTYTYVSSSLFNNDDFDDFEKIEDLEEKLDELSDSSKKLVDGAFDLKDGTGEVDKAVGVLAKNLLTYKKDGVHLLTDGVNTLHKSSKKLVNGVNDYANGAITFADGTKQYVDGASKITKGCSDLYDAVSDMPNQIKEFNKGISDFTEGVDKLAAKENIEAVRKGSKALTNGVNKVHETIDEAKSLNDQAKQIMKTILEKASASPEFAQILISNPELMQAVTGLQQLIEGEGKYFEGLKTATGKLGDLGAGVDNLSKGVETVLSNLELLAANTSKIRTGSETLNTKLPVLVENIKKLKEGGATLSKADKKLLSGSKSLIKASKKVKKSIGTVKTGVSKLNKGGKKLNKATDKLVNGVNKLKKGTNKLDDGAKKLADGEKKFDEKGIKELNKTFADKIKAPINRLKELLNIGKAYNNFSGLSDGMDGEVKFVIETDPIRAEEE